MEWLTIFVFYVVVPSLIVAGGAWLFQRKKARSEQGWAEVGQLLGLEYRDWGAQDMALSGRWRGHQIQAEVRMEIRRGGRHQSRHWYTTFVVDLEDDQLAQGLALAAGKDAKLLAGDEPRRALGGSGPYFELAPPNKAAQQALKNRKVQSTLSRLAKKYDLVRIEEGQLKVEICELLSDVDRLQKALEELLDTVDLLERSRG